MVQDPFDIFLRAATLLLFTLRYAYWRASEPKAHQAKPLAKTAGPREHAKRWAFLALGILVYIQVLGLPVWPFQPSLAVSLVGFVLVAYGFATSMSARHTLGANWAHGAEYQIKSGHELITTGIYRYVRHPIYTGIFLSMIGGELIAGSWLWLVLLGTLTLAAITQATKEERILLEEFGQKYQSYMRRTKRFIPYLW
ncbi:MAG TPA: isoprenylcysteine carboxylmethyltransferase family protein [Candidatus Saccharimonadia bacterium]|nr:isoprenylcysteine carboxylmethyltransferase family protein [Candidatus Saccharimonadia bacterium]